MQQAKLNKLPPLKQISLQKNYNLQNFWRHN
jgi:hypothetical protein